MNQVLTRNSLNVEYRKQKPQRPKVENFKTELLKCLTAIKDADAINESEEFMKAPISEFFKNTFYKDNLINTKGKIDLAIYTEKDVQSDVGVCKSS